MNLGFSTDDIGVLIIGGLLALFVPVIIIGIGALVGRIFGVRAGLFPLLFLLVVGFGATIGGSLYLDTAGRTITGRVVSKDERVQLRKEGDWRYTLNAALLYRLDGALPEGEFRGSNDSSTTLRLSGPQFDALRKDDTPQIKVLPLWNTITLVRLANTSTREWIPWFWLGIGAGVVALIWLAFKVARSRAGCLVVALVAIVGGVGVPSLVIYREWQAMENLAAKPLRATATIEDVTRVTRIDPLPCRGSCKASQNTEFDVPQPYDIVQMRFTPQNARDTVLAIDAADVGSAQVPKGGTVSIAYAAADPRAAQIIGATHAHHWRNMIGFVESELTTLLVGAALIIGLSWLWGRMQSAFRRRAGKNGTV